MEARAVARYVRVAPRKARLVVDLIRGKSVEEAFTTLKFVSRGASTVVEKVLRSAVANAEHNLDAQRADLYVSEAFVDEGPTIKRWRPRMRRRAFPILKRTSHITVVLGSRKEGS